MFGIDDAIIGAVAGPLIGGLFGGGAADNQASAIQNSGAATAAAADRATQAQQAMFNTQQANANTRYNQVRGDLSSLFGGSVNQNLTGANPGAGITGSAMTADQIRQMLLPHFTTTSGPAVGIGGGGSPDPNDYPGHTLPAYMLPQTSVDEAGLSAAIQQLMASQGQSGAAGAPSGIAPGSIFGSQIANNPQLQQILASLSGGANMLNQTAGSLNPLMSQFGNTATNQLQQFNSFNPQTMAQDIYSKLTALGNPQRQQDRANLESRLLNQGILTSSPGFSQINSMDQANGQQDLARQIQSQLTAQQQLQAFLQNATGAAGTMQNLAGAQGNLATQAGNLATSQQSVQNAALAPALQAAGIEAGVPVNSAQPIPSGSLSVAGAQAAGAANVNAANITNSFWSNLGNSIATNPATTQLFQNLGGSSLSGAGGSPIDTTGGGLGGSDGLFAMLNGYAGGV